MAAGSVSTPTSTTVTGRRSARVAAKQPVSRPSKAEETVDLQPGKRAGDNDPHRDAHRTPRITSQWPGVPNASAIAQAVSGKDDLEPMEAGETIRRAMHGDMRLGPSRTVGRMRTGSHVGARDAQIGQLEQEKAKLERDAKAGKLGSGAAGAADMLDRQIQQERGLNAVADVLHVLGANEDVVDALEDVEGVRVVRDGELAASAAYDHETGIVSVSQSLADQAGAAARMLHTQGLLDENGRVVEGREEDIDRSGKADELIKIGTLIGVHERMHAHQHEDGGLEEIEADIAADARRGEAELIGGLPFVPDGQSLQGLEDAYRTTDDAWELEEARVAAEEYEAYLAQEQTDLALGATLRVQLTTDLDGNALPKQQAVANIVALERGRPLPFGPDRNWLRPDVVEDLIDGLDIPVASVPWSGIHDSVSSSTILGEDPGWKRPGWKRPGWKRPGFATE